MLVVVLEVIDLLQVLVVLLGHILDVSQQVLVLQIHPPEQLIVVLLLHEHRLLILLSSLSKGE